MFDARIRDLTAPALDSVAARIALAGVSPLLLTTAGWVCGIGACVAYVAHSWPLAAALWLLNRLLDGLDGPVARYRGSTELGGFLDIVADFSIYAFFVVAVAVAQPAARLACLALLAAYYVSGTAFLALSSLTERRGDPRADQRSLRFVGGLAEGGETVAVYVGFCLFPSYAAGIAWVFTAAVAVTAGQRFAIGIRTLRLPQQLAPVPSPPVAVPAVAPAAGHES